MAQWVNRLRNKIFAGGLSRIGISYGFLRFWNLALAEKLCIPLNILGFYISITMKSYLESGNFVKKNCGIQNLLQKFSWCPTPRIFVNPQPLPLLYEISGALHLAQPGLTAGWQTKYR